MPDTYQVLNEQIEARHKENREWLKSLAEELSDVKDRLARLEGWRQIVGPLAVGALIALLDHVWK